MPTETCPVLIECERFGEGEPDEDDDILLHLLLLVFDGALMGVFKKEFEIKRWSC